VVLRCNTELVVEGVMPDLLHVIPVIYPLGTQVSGYLSFPELYHPHNKHRCGPC
jgi:hypothetical protein